MNKNFKYIGKYERTLSLSEILNNKQTLHINKNRFFRFKKALELNNNSEIDKSFLVDKGHPNGPEIHNVSEKGIIFIINAKTKKLVTILIARPNQIKRLYIACNLKVPHKIIQCSIDNVNNGYNYI